jgi:hypothetical protein
MADEDFDSQLGHWIAVFRDHGRPERELPPYSQETDEED